jgi:hypothetical protein
MRGRCAAWLLASLCLGSAAKGQLAYSVRSDGAGATADFLFAVDLGTGVATPIGPTGFQDIESLAFGAGCQTLYGVDDVSDSLVTCNVATGACTAIGTLGRDVTDTGLAFTTPTLLFMSTDAPKNPTNLYRLAPATGGATLVGDQGQSVTGLAAVDGTLFGLGGDAQGNLVVVSTTTGAATSIGPLGIPAFTDAGFDADAAGTLWGISDPGRSAGMIFTVSPTTGAASIIATPQLSGGASLGGFESLAIPAGACAGLAQAGVPAIPTVDGAGLAFLVAAIALAATWLLRRA